MKYQELMDGLEINEVLFSQLDSVKTRLDAEFYQKRDTQPTDEANSRLADIGLKIDCSAFYPAIVPYYNFERQGVPFLRVNEIQNGLVGLTDKTAFLPLEVLQENQSTIAIGYPGDIVVAKTGATLAKLGLITSEYPHYAISRDLILFRTDSLNNINKHFLWVLLHSKFGQRALWRSASQTGQPHLTVASISEIRLKRFSTDFENLFERIYCQSTELKQFSLAVYKQAEALLLSSLNLQSWQPPNEGTAVRSFKDSFSITGRLDAEYYQPKYAAIKSRLKAEGAASILRRVCQVKDKAFFPRDKERYKYIELSNVDGTGGITGYTEDYGMALPSRARRAVATGDVIISSIEGSF